MWNAEVCAKSYERYYDNNNIKACKRDAGQRDGYTHKLIFVCTGIPSYTVAVLSRRVGIGPCRLYTGANGFVGVWILPFVSNLVFIDGRKVKFFDNPLPRFVPPLLEVLLFIFFFDKKDVLVLLYCHIYDYMKGTEREASSCCALTIR